MNQLESLRYCVLYVCRSCHDADLRATGCKKDFDKHLKSIIITKCDVCGKENDHIAFCIAYAQRQEAIKQNVICM